MTTGNNTTLNLRTSQDLAGFLTGIFAPHLTALQGILDKVPEALKPDFKKLKDDLDAALTKLKPTDQVPAALDAGYALQSLANGLERMQEYASELTKKLASMTQSFNDKATALQGLEQKVTSGELITKQVATDLCDKARTDAIAGLKPAILAMRKSQVELAGLPLPADDVLALEEKDFTPRFDAAKANVAALGQRGCKIGGKGAGLVKDLAWLTATEFAGKLTSYEDVLGKAPTGDPLLGGTGPAPGSADGKKKNKMW